jgi:rare lipoprotein A
MKNQLRYYFIFCFYFATIHSNGFVEKQKMEISKDTLKEQDSNSYQSTSSGYTGQEEGKFEFYKKNAHASYYADKIHGRTASGGFDKNKYTAAHKKLPLAQS